MNSLVILLMTVFVMYSCHNDPNKTKVQFMPDMADGPTMKAQENYLDPPPYSVPMNAIIYPATVEEAEKVFENRFEKTEQTLAKGQKLYETYCIVCHGPDAKGEGYLGNKYPRPPDITSAQYKDRKDGFYFYRITWGSALMPGYGHAISPDERWQIIIYLRSLQGGA